MSSTPTTPRWLPRVATLKTSSDAPTSRTARSDLRASMQIDAGSLSTTRSAGATQITKHRVVPSTSTSSVRSSFSDTRSSLSSPTLKTRETTPNEKKSVPASPRPASSTSSTTTKSIRSLSRPNTSASISQHRSTPSSNAASTTSSTVTPRALSSVRQYDSNERKVVPLRSSASSCILAESAQRSKAGSMPMDVLGIIFSMLSFRNVISHNGASLVCTQWYEASCQEFLWRRWYQQKWGDPERSLRRFFIPPTTWHDMSIRSKYVAQVHRNRTESNLRYALYLESEVHEIGQSSGLVEPGQGKPSQHSSTSFAANEKFAFWCEYRARLVFVLDLETGKRIKPLLHPMPVTHLVSIPLTGREQSFSDPYLVLTACSDNTIRLWNVTNCTIVRKFSLAPALILCLQVNATGTMFAASAYSTDGSLHIWSIRNEYRPVISLGESQELLPLNGQKQKPTKPLLSFEGVHDGRSQIDWEDSLIACASSQTISVISLTEQKTVWQSETVSGQVTALTWAYHSRPSLKPEEAPKANNDFEDEPNLLWAGLSDGSLLLFDLRLTTPILQFSAFSGAPIKKIAVFGHDEDTVMVWVFAHRLTRFSVSLKSRTSVDSVSPTALVPLCTPPFISVGRGGTRAANGNVLALTANDKWGVFMGVWDAAGASRLARSMLLHNNALFMQRISNGKLLTASDTHICIWDFSAPSPPLIQAHLRSVSTPCPPPLPPADGDAAVGTLTATPTPGYSSFSFSKTPFSAKATPKFVDRDFGLSLNSYIGTNIEGRQWL